MAHTPPQALCLADDNLQLRIFASALGYVTRNQAINSTKSKLRGAICDGLEGDGFNPGIIRRLRAKNFHAEDAEKLLSAVNNSEDHQVVMRGQAAYLLAT